MEWIQDGDDELEKINLSGKQVEQHQLIYDAQGTRLWIFRVQVIYLFCLLQLVGIGHSFADNLDVFNLEADVQQTFDNNLFRLPDAVDPYNLGLGKHERSDSITTGSLGVLVDQPIGLQKLHFEALESYNHYQNYGYLDGNTTNYNASWQLAVTRALTGTLSTQRSQSAASFVYYNTYNVRNIITQDTTDLNLDWSPLGNWHMTADLAKRTYVNSENNTQVLSNDYNYVEGGIKYVFSSGASLGWVHDKSIGTFRDQLLDVQNQLDTGYEQNEDKIVLAWPITGKSLVNAQVGNVDRKYDHFSSRNYSGTTGNVSYSNDFTSTINLTASAARAYNPYADNNESYYGYVKRTIQASWMPRSKLTLKLRFDSYTNDYRGPIPGVTVLVPRIDNGNTRTLEADWAFTRTVTLVGAVIWDQRGSTALAGSPGCTYAGCGFNDTSVNFSVNAKF